MLKVINLNSLFANLIKVQILAFLVLGIVFTFLLPPFQSPDEPAHWGIAYQRTEKIFSVFRGESEKCLPAYSLPWHFEVGRIAFDAGQKFRQSSFDHLNKIKPSCDVPPVTYGGVLTYPGVIISRLMLQLENVRPDRALKVFYLARLFQGSLVLTSLIWLFGLARRANEFSGVLTIATISLSPLLVQQSFSVSADTVTLCLAIFCAGSMLFWTYLNKWDLFFLCMFGAVSSFTKPPLFPMVPISLITGIALSYFMEQPRHLNSFISTHRKRLYGSVAVVLVCLIATLLISLAKHEVPANQLLGRTLGLSKQLEFITSNPGTAFSAINDGFIERFNTNGLTNYLGWLSLKLSKFSIRTIDQVLYFVVALEILLVLCNWVVFVRRKERRPFLNRMLFRIGITSCSIAGLYLTALLTPLVMYLLWTEVGLGVVQGLQGRYFLPFALLLPATLALLFKAPIVGGVEPSTEPNNSFSAILSFLACATLLSLDCMLAVSIFQDLMQRYW